MPLPIVCFNAMLDLNKWTREEVIGQGGFEGRI
jgi:hypothetical protein